MRPAVARGGFQRHEDAPAGAEAEPILGEIAMDRGLKGVLLAPSAYLMKSPPEQWSDETARLRLERFIAGGA
jgi:hypothetical protein